MIKIIKSCFILYCRNGSKPQKWINGASNTQYGDRRLKQGDVLEIKFDQKNNRLEYSVNGESQGIAFENLPPQKYKLGITLARTGDKVTLVGE